MLHKKSDMKTFKKILLALLLLFVSSAVGGYFYFDQKFTPAQNSLTVSGGANDVAIQWMSENENPYAALLLPVQIKGIDQQLYMQLDFGAPSTIFYKKSLQSLQEKFPQENIFRNETDQVALNFNLAAMQVSSNAFAVLDYGTKVDFENPQYKNIIGTIGTDLLEKRVIQMDFTQNRCAFSEKTPHLGFTDFEFTKRKILIPAKMGDENLKLLYDSGASGYELITSKTQWKQYRTRSKEFKIEKGNSWGNTLQVISAPANGKIQMGNILLKLSEVTYIEGTSQIQKLLMQFSGMQGMIGNKIFLGHKVTLDCKNEKFKVE